MSNVPAHRAGENDEEHVNEQSSLLCHTGPSMVEDGAPHNDHADEITTENSRLTRRTITLCTMLMVAAALVEVISLFQMLATNEILEDIICSHLGSRDQDIAINCGENEAVQAELALLRGWQVTFDYIPGKTSYSLLDFGLYAPFQSNLISVADFQHLRPPQASSQQSLTVY